MADDADVLLEIPDDPEETEMVPVAGEDPVTAEAKKEKLSISFRIMMVFMWIAMFSFTTGLVWAVAFWNNCRPGGKNVCDGCPPKDCIARGCGLWRGWQCDTIKSLRHRSGFT